MAIRQVCGSVTRTIPGAGMMTQLFQARALYDFEAEPGTGEVTIRVGEVLTITRTDVGEGWWEGRTPGGESGLFPEVSYMR